MGNGITHRLEDGNDESGKGSVRREGWLSILSGAGRRRSDGIEQRILDERNWPQGMGGTIE